MLKNLFIPFCFAIIILGCKPQKEKADEQANFHSAKGGKHYGGVFRVNESDYIKNLFPHAMTDAISYRVANQIYEGLMKFNQQDLSLKNSLAESYTTNDAKTEYTFKIKKGVYFHDDPCFSGGKGRELKASDIKYCFELLCSYSPQNQGFSMFQHMLEGADEYYENSKKSKNEQDLKGIEVIDDYSLKFKLTKPNSLFLYNLARPFTYIFPKEAYEKYGLEMRNKAVGTGPFQISKIEDDVTILLVRNKNYHEKDEHGNQLPFLDQITVKFIKDKKSELLEFKKGKLEMMYRLPTDYIIEILDEVSKKKGDYGQYDLQRTPEMATHFLSFLNQGKIFSNKNVRKAFSFAINRKHILEAVLNGEGYAPATSGITPLDIFKNPLYDVKQIKGYEYNPDSAKYYLNKAGYKDARNFPKIVLELNSDGERNVAVAEEIQKQLKETLNIDIELNILPFSQLVDNMINGKSAFFRGGWIADYPNPENFLWFFYGKTVPQSLNEPSYPNMMRYKSEKFDKLYEQGIAATTAEEAFKHFMEAENVVMDDAPIIVLWYDEGYRLMQSYVKDFPNNAMQYRDFSTVYFDIAKLKKE